MAIGARFIFSKLSWAIYYTAIDCIVIIERKTRIIDNFLHTLFYRIIL